MLRNYDGLTREFDLIVFQHESPKTTVIAQSQKKNGPKVLPCARTIRSFNAYAGKSEPHQHFRVESVFAVFGRGFFRSAGALEQLCANHR